MYQRWFKYQAFVNLDLAEMDMYRYKSEYKFHGEIIALRETFK